MKVIIDLIEDIRTAINNDTGFSLKAMGLRETEKGEFIPAWEANVCSMKLDDEKQKLFLFLAKEEALSTGDILERLNRLENKKMMHEICISYSKGSQRIDSALLGFGEAVHDRKYLLFIPE